MKEDVIDDLIRLLSGCQTGNVDMNHVANYFLASKLMSKLGQMKSSTTHKINEKVKVKIFTCSINPLPRFNQFCIQRLKIQRKMNLNFFANLKEIDLLSSKRLLH